MLAYCYQKQISPKGVQCPVFEPKNRSIIRFRKPLEGINMTEPSSTIWTYVGQIVFLMGCGIMILTLQRLKAIAQEWLTQRRLHPIAKSVLANKEVNALLIELRTKTKADRACVFLFHNGQTFTNKNPLWRVSCTQECCRPGISHEIGNLQNMLASLFWDGIQPLFETSAGVDCGPGITMHSAMAGQLRVYRIKAHELSDTYYKRSLLATGIRVAYLTPIIDGKKEIVGYISLSYCLEDEVPPPEEILTVLVEAAGLIHFALTKA